MNKQEKVLMWSLIVFAMAFVMQLSGIMIACAILSLCAIIGVFGYIVIDVVEFIDEIKD